MAQNEPDEPKIGRLLTKRLLFVCLLGCRVHLVHHVERGSTSGRRAKGVQIPPHHSDAVKLPLFFGFKNKSEDWRAGGAQSGFARSFFFCYNNTRTLNEED
jgi:hypothetical protein